MALSRTGASCTCKFHQQLEGHDCSYTQGRSANVQEPVLRQLYVFNASKINASKTSQHEILGSGCVPSLDLCQPSLDGWEMHSSERITGNFKACHCNRLLLRSIVTGYDLQLHLLNLLHTLPLCPALLNFHWTRLSSQMCIIIHVCLGTNTLYIAHIPITRWRSCESRESDEMR